MGNPKLWVLESVATCTTAVAAADVVNDASVMTFCASSTASTVCHRRLFHRRRFDHEPYRRRCISRLNEDEVLRWVRSSLDTAIFESLNTTVSRSLDPAFHNSFTRPSSLQAYALSLVYEADVAVPAVADVPRDETALRHLPPDPWAAEMMAVCAQMMANVS